MHREKPLKIIHLSGFSRDLSELPFSIDDDKFYVASWAGLIARRLKVYQPELNIELWRSEEVVTQKKTKSVFGIEATLWPYRYPLIKDILTFEMYYKILQLTKSFKVIVHYHSLFDRFALLKYLLPKDVRIILSHHGGNPPKEGTLKDRFITQSYKRVDAITYLSERARKYLHKIGYNNDRMHFLPVGADFQTIKPIEKNKARELLNLEKDKIYAIYVGSFYRLKSVDLILEMYNQFKIKYNFSVIFVGGSENISNDLYKEVRDSGCPFFGRQEWTDMPTFYSAADFYIHPAFNPEFGGLDVSWIEALACNKPVLSPQLNYLDFDYGDLGIYVGSVSELVDKTEKMINGFNNFFSVRDTAQKHLDGKSAIMEKLVKIYSNIV